MTSLQCACAVTEGSTKRLFNSVETKFLDYLASDNTETTASVKTSQ